MRTLLAIALAVSVGFGLVGWTTGCGHSVEPKPPFGDAQHVPSPRRLAAAVNVTDITLTWSATLADFAVVDGWHVDRRPATQTTFTRLTEHAIVDTFFVDAMVTDNVRYAYRVIAITGAGVESRPAEIGPIRADTSAPGVPLDVAVVARPQALEVSFRLRSEPDVAYYELRLDESGTTNPPRFVQTVSSPTTIDGLLSGTLYDVSVAAVDSAGRQSPFSDPVSGTPTAPHASMESPGALKRPG